MPLNVHKPLAGVVQSEPTCESAGVEPFAVVCSPATPLSSMNSCMTAPASGLPFGSTFFRTIASGWQLLISTGAGAMKSLSAAVNESEDRLFRYAEPKDLHTAGSSTPAASRSIAASPNVRGLSVAPVYGSTTGAVLTLPTASVPRALTLLQQGREFDASQTVDATPLVLQKWMPNVGCVPPCERSYLIRTSPAVRTGVTPLLLSTRDWLNSKSMFVVPVGSWTRSQARYR